MTHTTRRRDRASDGVQAPDPSLSASALADAIEIATKAEGRFTIDLTVRATGAHFRIAPARDPRQPRLWCICVRQHRPGGMPDDAGLAWFERPGLAWAELTEVLGPLRGDLPNWLAMPDRAALCRWMLTAPPLPTAAETVGLSAGAATRSSRRRNPW